MNIRKLCQNYWSGTCRVCRTCSAGPDKLPSQTWQPSMQLVSLHVTTEQCLVTTQAINDQVSSDKVAAKQSYRMASAKSVVWHTHCWKELLCFHSMY